MTTYQGAQDEMFAAVKAVFDGTATSLLGYAPDLRWLGAPAPSIPDRSRLWARVSSQIVDDSQASLSDVNGKRFFWAIGLLYVQLFCPRNVAGSLPNGRSVAEALQSQFRVPSISGEIWYRSQKIVELDETEESYPLNFSVQFQYKTLSNNNVDPVIPFGPHGVARGILVSGSGNNFTLPFAPIPPEGLMLFGSGSLLSEGVGEDFILSGVNITTAMSWASGLLRAWYPY